jgi:hypothetical protein
MRLLPQCSWGIPCVWRGFVGDYWRFRTTYHPVFMGKYFNIAWTPSPNIFTQQFEQHTVETSKRHSISNFMIRLRNIITKDYLSKSQGGDLSIDVTWDHGLEWLEHRDHRLILTTGHRYPAPLPVSLRTTSHRCSLLSVSLQKKMSSSRYTPRIHECIFTNWI